MFVVTIIIYVVNFFNKYFNMITNFLNKGTNFAKKVIGKTGAVTGLAGAVGSRLSAAGLPLGGIFSRKESALPSQVATPSATQDWGVTISLPRGTFDELMADSNILAPAGKEKQYPGLRFPTTPAIFMSHSASYDARAVLHNNYPYYAYQNSQVDAMTINGSFPVMNQEDGLRYLSNLHFLRTVTKMYYGKGNNVGNPPPICKLNGYGDYIFKDVPVIITNFTTDLRQDVDYIAVNVPTQTADEVLESPTFKGGPPSVNYAQSPAVQRQVEKSGVFNYVPTDSQITIQVVPVYSRNKVSRFDLKSFAQGKLAKDGFI